MSLEVRGATISRLAALVLLQLMNVCAREVGYPVLTAAIAVVFVLEGCVAQSCRRNFDDA